MISNPSTMETIAGDAGNKSQNKTPPKESSSEPSAGIYSTGFNLANMILGVGALGMPSAFSDSGIISGLILLALMCLAGHFTALLLVKCANKVGVDSYEKLTEKILGSGGYLFFCVLCTFTNIGAGVCYIMFISQCVGLGNFGLIILCTLVILPLSFVKDWESLSILSKIKTFVYVIVVLFILLRPWNDEEASSPKKIRAFSEFMRDRQTWFSMNIFKSMGTFAFGSVYHDCLFPVRKGLKDQTVKGWGKTSAFTLFIVYAISTVLGIGGFINFRPITKTLASNVLDAKDHRLFSNDVWFKIARYTLVGLMLVTVPLCIHCARDYVEAIITKVKEMCFGQKETKKMMVEHVFFDDGKQVIVKEETKKATKKFNIAIGILNIFRMTLLEYLIASSLFAFSMLGAIVLNDKSGVEAIIDAIGNYAMCTIGYVWPCIIFLCTFKRKEYSVWTLIMILLILAWGLFVWFFETSQHFKMNWEFEKEQKQCDVAFD